jgi:ornithine cyclodeaminase
VSSGRPTDFLILGADAVRAALPMAACIDLMVETMAAVSQGKAVLPLRTVTPIPRSENRLGVMPGHLAEPDVLGAKLICLYPDNPRRGLSSHTGVIILFEAATGQIRALLDAAEITGLRTAAATAAASRALARRDAGDLAVLGTGEQALAHLKALAIVHELRRVRVWGRDIENARALSHRASALCPAPIEVCVDARDAVDGADLICTVTASSEPILEGGWLSPGVHVNLVGASVQTSSEIDVAGVARASYFVDYRPSALAQAGELKRAMDAGAVGPDHILAEIGEVHLGVHPGRRADSEITVYKSLGVAAQDLAAADAIYKMAGRLGLGTAARL